MSSHDKQWAREYILDPLTAPEPNQETGPGTSFYSPERQSLLQSHPSARSPSSSSSSPRSTHGVQRSSSARHPPNQRAFDIRRKPQAESASGIITPPSSASPTSNRSFHPSNPFSRASPTGPSPTSPTYQTSLGRSSSHRRYPPVASAGRGNGDSRSNSSSGRRHSRSVSLDESRHKSSDERAANLPPRFHGDLSHRPLEMIKQQNRAAHRSSGSGSGHRRKVSDVDTIDALDTIGGTYHHGGPFDATLASRNVNVKYPPVDAVHETNMEAIRATPKEFIQDSLTKHVPLQGIATIPAGETDMSGNVMQFEEGADLMREKDAAGGAYKRWDCIPYHPDDLKGKGEPSYTYERDKAKNKGLQHGEYEMQSGVNGDGVLGPAGIYGPGPPASRPRSVSNVDKATTSATVYRTDESSSHLSPGGSSSSASGVRRSNTTGKKLSDGLKKRFGSIRRKRDDTTVE